VNLLPNLQQCFFPQYFIHRRQNTKEALLKIQRQVISSFITAGLITTELNLQAFFSHFYYNFKNGRLPEINAFIANTDK
jgi:hypothetical protein